MSRIKKTPDQGQEIVTVIMWGSAIAGLALLAFGSATKNNYVKTFLILLAAPCLWVAHRIWDERKQEKHDAESHQLARLLGADYDKAVNNTFLDRFADNPWQSWPKFDGDIDVGRILVGHGEPPAFYIVDVSFNKKNRDEDLAAYTVTFVIVPLPAARPGHLEQWMIPKYYKAVEGTGLLYLYREKSWNDWGEGAHLAADVIPDALAHAKLVATKLAEARRRR